MPGSCRKYLLILFVLLASRPAVGGDCVLENDTLKIAVSPEGGKIVSFLYKPSGVDFAAGPAGTGQGFAKERLHGLGSWEFAGLTFELRQTGPDSVVMSAEGKIPPFDRIRLTRTVTLHAGYVAVSSVYENTNPVLGQVEIVPVAHNALQFDPGVGCEVILPHDQGFHLVKYDVTRTGQVAMRKSANWLACRVPGKGGVMLIAKENPEFLYTWIGRQGPATLEMYFPRGHCTPSRKVEYLLVPFTNLDNTLQTPITPVPALPKPGEVISHSEGTVFKDNEINDALAATEPKSPVTIRHAIGRTSISPDVLIPVYFYAKSDTPRNGEGVTTVFEIPADFVLASWAGQYWWHLDERMDFVKCEPCERAGRDYNRYFFNYRMKSYNAETRLRLFLAPRKNALPGVIASYGLVNGEKGLESLLPVGIIPIPQAKVPKNFITCFNIDWKLLEHYPDYAEHLHHLGVNHLGYNYNIYTADREKQHLGEVKRHLAEVRASGFGVSVMGWHYFQPSFGPEECALDLDGNPTKLFDFTAHGKCIDDAREQLLRPLEYGFDIILSDWEHYHSGERISFTERTLAAFRKFLAEKHPGTEWVDPREIARYPGKFPAQEKIWTDFKCREYAEVIGQQVRPILEKHPGVAFGLMTLSRMSHESMKRIHLQDHDLLAEFIKYDMPMLYNNGYGSMPRAPEEFDLFMNLCQANGSKFWPTLTTGCDSACEGKPRDTKNIIIEAAMSKAIGYWNFPGFPCADAEDLANMAQANTLIAETEDILLAGERADETVMVEAFDRKWNKPTALKPKVIRVQNRCVVWLAEYSTHDIDVAVKIANGEKYQITELETGEIAVPASEWKTTLAGETRGRLFLLEK
jgi:hypothetical protein